MAINSLSLDFSNLNIPKRQAGYTLIELSISIAIIAVLLVGALAGTQRLLRSNNANNTVTQTQAAVTNITKLYASTGDSGIYVTSTLANLGVWESAAVKSETSGTVTTKTISHPLGGTILVAANTASVGTATSGTGYWYRIQGVPEDTCATLATSFASTAAAIYVVAGPTTQALAGGTPASVGYKVPGSANSASNLATGCAFAKPEVALFFTSN